MGAEAIDEGPQREPRRAQDQAIPVSENGTETTGEEDECALG
jgi:hypothetical protein